MIAPRCALLGALVTAAACAPRGAPGPGFLVPPPRSIAPPSACDVPGDAAAAPDTLSVAVPGAVDPAHAPVPVTGGERVLFRQLYETLLRPDCEGRLHPALAAACSTADRGAGRRRARAGAAVAACRWRSAGPPRRRRRSPRD